MMTSQAACPERTLIDRHFRGSISPLEEQQLRRHLPDCDPCRTRYDRHLLNAQLAGGLPRSDRLAIGLGLPRAPARRWPAVQLSLVGAATAAVVLLFVLRQRAAEGPEVVPEYTARGAPAAAGPSLQVYRLDPRAGQVAVGGWIRPGDELAFAYGNPTGFRHLAVFGADETGKIYWFFPAWQDPGADPVALSIDRTAHRELPEAIGHAYQGGKLRLVGLFLNQPASVRTLEQHVRRGDLSFADLPGARTVETALEIRR
jgi:hypothetical protein